MKLTAYDEFIKVMPTVRLILESDLDARDDDNVLCIRVWEKQFKGRRSFANFKKALISKEIASPETIGRSRRKLQENHISLRGKLYNARHKAEEQFINQYKIEF